MTVPFNNIPAGNSLRVPLFYAEMDNSQANIFSQTLKSLLIGQRSTVSGITYGSAVSNTPYVVTSQAQANSLFGNGSMLARMYMIFRLNNPQGEVWAMAPSDAGAGVAATSTITITTTLTGPFASTTYVINLYVAGQRIQVPYTLNDTVTSIANYIVAGINAATDLPVTATSALGVVTLTAKWKGLTGNDIVVQDSFRSTAGSELAPYGLNLVYAAGTAGATNPTLTTAISALGDEPYDFIIHPYTDSTSILAVTTELSDTVGRWSWSRQIYGHAYTAVRGTLSALITLGGLYNDQHHTIAAIDVDCPNPSWEYAAAYGGRNAVYIAADPARPTQTGQLTGIIPPRVGKRFLLTDCNSLLGYGIATSTVVAGVLQIQRAITNYQKNAFGVADISYLDSETLHTAAYVLRYLQSAITSKYARHKLANDGTRFSAGNPVVTPNVIRGELIAAYDALVALGLVENRDAFATYLIVERDITSANRLNILFPPDYVNQLRIFAVLNQFRLQY
ncbi:MAG: hypothetical protein RIR39_1557 [Pseudomonadota bacterium]